MTDHDLLAIACEQFLGKSVMEIKAVVLQTLEGHLRSILGNKIIECECSLSSHLYLMLVLWVDAPQTVPCSLSGTLTVEQIYQDRDQFAQLVREVAAPDVGRMGIEILSFTIKVSTRSQTHLICCFGVTCVTHCCRR